jgi:branched-chain amino acid transport system permease protein
MVLIMIWRPRGLVATREPSLYLGGKNDKKAISASLVKQGQA